MSQNDEQNAPTPEEMNRREFIKRTAVGTGALALTMTLPGFMMGNAGAATPDLSKLPLKYKDYNIVLVSFDALQAAHVGSLGYKRNVTPTIDAMAKEGISFSQNISVASWTVPASMTWFTGVYPSEHKLTNKFSVFNPPAGNKLSNMKELAPELVTLAEVLKENGYATGGFTGNAGVSGFFGYGQGFDRYFFEKGKFGSMGVSIPKAMEWLQENKNKKFFMFLHGYDCHGQNVPEGGFDYRFVDKGYDKKFTGSAKEQEALREEGLEKGSVALRDEDVKFWRAIYDEKIQRTDAMFKGFLAQLEKMGLMDKTIFILTSDHGELFGEHGLLEHSNSLYREVIHVPLIFWWPGRVPASQRVAQPVTNAALPATLLDLIGAEGQTQFPGPSLAQLWEQPDLKHDWPDPLAEVAQIPWLPAQFLTAHGAMKSVLDPQWQYIVHEKFGEELYEWSQDPQETVNRVDDPVAQPALDRLRAILK